MRSGLSAVFSATLRKSVQLLLAALALAGGSSLGWADDDLAFFEKRIRPVLVERCHRCHSASGKASGNLVLEDAGGWLQGGDSGPAVVPHKPSESLLLAAVRYDEDGPQMPPEGEGKRFSSTEVAAFEEWIRRGAPAPLAEARIAGMTVREARAWWSFQPLAAPLLPDTSAVDRPANPIDQFVGAQLAGRAMTPARPADRRTLIRRLTFDLTGLPPTPREVKDFESDPSPAAYSRLVDRLLNSPAYGQRWARHWLDVVRYADYYDANAKARQVTAEPLDAWRYRDWVARSFNQDLPYDQFVEHQIAGDLLRSPACEEVYADGLIATSFLSNGVWDPHDADKEKVVSDIVDDNIDTVGKAFLGLTLGCARCHDHKFDPISTADYYGLAGIFYSSHILDKLGTKGGAYTMNRIPLAPPAEVQRWNAIEEELAKVNGKLANLDKTSPKLPPDAPERQELTKRKTELVSRQFELPRAIAVQEGGTPGGLFPNVQDVPIHLRGSYTRLGKVVPRGVPQFLAGKDPPSISEGSGRRELADWVCSPNNPLVARVIVNRVWTWHFGQGLVRTPNNFGRLGESPSHPKLLDWLAHKFIEDGWSIKNLQRQIVTSQTYRQSDRVREEQRREDPENRWLARFSSRRLEAESIRDAMLSVSGQLDLEVGGPAGVDFTIRRRSLYVQTARWKRSSYAILFDAANPDASTAVRGVSTVAPQALLLLNHPFVLEQAEALAARLIREVPDGGTARLHRAHQLLFGRDATTNEIAIARRLLADDDATSWRDWTHVLLCSNEFVFVD